MRSFDFNIYLTFKKSFDSYKKGKKVQIARVKIGRKWSYAQLIPAKKDLVPIAIHEELAEYVEFEIKNVEQYWIVQQVLHNIPWCLKEKIQISNGMTVQKILGILEKKDKKFEIYKKPKLEGYLKELVAKIAPQKLIDGRRLVKPYIRKRYSGASAAVHSSGLILVDLGLFAFVRTEDEVVATIAHEMAHYVLAHQFKCLYEQDVKHIEHTPDYFQNQELEADRKADDILKLLGYNPDGGDLYLYRQYLFDQNPFKDDETHPDYETRLNGRVPELREDFQYCERMIDVVREVAEIACTHQSRKAIVLANYLINSPHVAPEDYLYRGRCVILNYNDEEHIQQGLCDIDLAIQSGIDPESLTIYLARFNAVIKLKNLEEAEIWLDNIQNLISRDGWDEELGNRLIDLCRKDLQKLKDDLQNS